MWSHYKVSGKSESSALAKEEPFDSERPKGDHRYQASNGRYGRLGVAAADVDYPADHGHQDDNADRAAKQNQWIEFQEDLLMNTIPSAL